MGDRPRVLKRAVSMADASLVTLANALAAAGFPFSGIDFVFSIAVGVLLLVVVVGARLAISRSRRRVQPRLVRAPRPARAETDVAASG